MNPIVIFFESNAGKYIKNLIIGLGASVVLMGALFKIQHWPGASVMLTSGMITEAVIFAMLGLSFVQGTVLDIVSPLGRGAKAASRSSRILRANRSQGFFGALQRLLHVRQLHHNDSVSTSASHVGPIAQRPLITSCRMFIRVLSRCLVW